jgi:hypothetical protein
MAGVRRARIFFTAVWLVMQAALLASPSVVLLAAAHEETGAECTCAHGDHAICPMHHRPAPGTRICLIGSADDTLATLGSLFQPAGLMPSITSAVPLEPIPTASVESTFTITCRSAPPDSPPPRA